MSKLIINFPVTKYALPESEDTIQIIIEFDTISIGDDTVISSTDNQILIAEYGRRETSYKLEEAFMVPGSYDLKIHDALSALDHMFFAPGIAAGYISDKQAKLTIKKNGVTDFIGTLVEDSIKSNVSKKFVSFKAQPKTENINLRMIYDENNNALNPFSLTANNYYRISYVLQQIFSLVNPDVTQNDIEIIHDWTFQGTRDDIACNLNDITFTELFQDIDPLFFDAAFGLRNCGDVLKKYALDWCSFTGLISLNKPFFKKLFHYNSSNTQPVTVWHWEKAYKYGLIDYVKVTTNISGPSEPYTQGTFTELEGRYLIRKSLPGFWNDAGGTRASNIKAVISRSGYFVFDHGSTLGEAAHENAVYSNNGSQFKVVGTPVAGTVTRRVPTKKISGSNNPEASGTLTLVSGEGPASITYSSYGDADGTYTIYQARDPNLFDGAWKDHGALLAKFWHNYRGNINNCRVDYFILKGTNYNYLKDFTHEGLKFQPIEMKADDKYNITECEALYLGEL
jgi:hypothetical protein